MDNTHQSPPNMQGNAEKLRIKTTYLQHHEVEDFIKQKLQYQSQQIQSLQNNFDTQNNQNTNANNQVNIAISTNQIVQKNFEQQRQECFQQIFSQKTQIQHLLLSFNRNINLITAQATNSNDQVINSPSFLYIFQIDGQDICRSRWQFCNLPGDVESCIVTCHVAYDNPQYQIQLGDDEKILATALINILPQQQINNKITGQPVEQQIVPIAYKTIQIKTEQQQVKTAKKKIQKPKQLETVQQQQEVAVEKELSKPVTVVDLTTKIHDMGNQRSIVGINPMAQKISTEKSSITLQNQEKPVIQNQIEPVKQEKVQPRRMFTPNYDLLYSQVDITKMAEIQNTPSIQKIMKQNTIKLKSTINEPVNLQITKYSNHVEDPCILLVKSNIILEPNAQLKLLVFDKYSSGQFLPSAARVFITKQNQYLYLVELQFTNDDLGKIIYCIATFDNCQSQSFVITYQPVISHQNTKLSRSYKAYLLDLSDQNPIENCVLEFSQIQTEKHINHTLLINQRQQFNISQTEIYPLHQFVVNPDQFFKQYNIDPLSPETLKCKLLSSLLQNQKYALLSQNNQSIFNEFAMAQMQKSPLFAEIQNLLNYCAVMINNNQVYLLLFNNYDEITQFKFLIDIKNEKQLFYFDYLDKQLQEQIEQQQNMDISFSNDTNMLTTTEYQEKLQSIKINGEYVKNQIITNQMVQVYIACPQELQYLLQKESYLIFVQKNGCVGDIIKFNGNQAEYSIKDFHAGSKLFFVCGRIKYELNNQIENLFIKLKNTELENQLFKLIKQCSKQKEYEIHVMQNQIPSECQLCFSDNQLELKNEEYKITYITKQNIQNFRVTKGRKQDSIILSDGIISYELIFKNINVLFEIWFILSFSGMQSYYHNDEQLRRIQQLK